MSVVSVGLASWFSHPASTPRSTPVVHDCRDVPVRRLLAALNSIRPGAGFPRLQGGELQYWIAEILTDSRYRDAGRNAEETEKSNQKGKSCADFRLLLSRNDENTVRIVSFRLCLGRKSIRTWWGRRYFVKSILNNCFLKLSSAQLFCSVLLARNVVKTFL